MHLADAFIQSDLHSDMYTFFVSMCVPWELNPQPFALLTQCSNHWATGTLKKGFNIASTSDEHINFSLNSTL